MRIVFDLDGTLIDSAPDIHAAVNRTARSFGKPELSLAQVTSFIGNGVPKLVERVMAARDVGQEEFDTWLAAFNRNYDADPASLTRPYDGVLEALEELHGRGHRLGVCTNKPRATANAILDQLGLLSFFDVVVGGDSLTVKKPDPKPLRAAFEALGTGPNVYVGDSEVDAECASRAETEFWLFSQGYRKSPVSTIKHDKRFDQFAELVNLL